MCLLCMADLLLSREALIWFVGTVSAYIEANCYIGVRGGTHIYCGYDTLVCVFGKLTGARDYFSKRVERIEFITSIV